LQKTEKCGVGGVKIWGVLRSVAVSTFWMFTACSEFVETHIVRVFTIIAD